MDEKTELSFNTPTKDSKPHLVDVIGSFYDLWKHFKRNQLPSNDLVIKTASN